MSGYVLIHRALIGHPAFRNDAEAMAFAWLVAKAAWRSARVRYKGHAITLQRGQLAVSVRDMAHALDRDKAWVERLWKRLKSETMIETRNETGVTVITIRNYNEYQSEPKSGETQGKPLGKAANETAARQTRDTEQRREEGNKSSEDKSSGDPPSQNIVKDLFDLGVALLIEAGVSEKEARSLVGKWKKSRGEVEVMKALLDCKRDGSIANPVEWLTARLRSARYVSKSGYEYRGDDDAVMREAEKRADWDTFWAVKGQAARMAADG